MNIDNFKNFIKKLRKKRAALFFNKIKGNSEHLKILDLGGTINYWEDIGFLNNSIGLNFEITLLNLDKVNVKHQNFKSIKGDATNLSNFKDNQFDIVFSNSLIEHLCTYKNMKLMASETMRVGKKFFVQTPNRYFPIEPHYFFPFFQFMPYNMKKFLMTKTKLIESKKHDENSVKRAHYVIRLLSKKELKSLFPSGKIFSEKLFGLNKSFMITNL